MEATAPLTGFTMQPSLPTAERQSSPSWFDLLGCMRECAADHIRVAITDALIAVEHDWMVSSFINQSTAATAHLKTLAQARGNIVDEVEARFRSRFEALETPKPPSMQSEMDRARSAKAVRGAIAKIEEDHAGEIFRFGLRFAQSGRGQVLRALDNPLEPEFLVEQVLETVAGLELPYAMRAGVLEAFAREWARDLPRLARDLNDHITRHEKEVSVAGEQGATSMPPKTSSPLRKEAITQVRSAYDAFEWSTTLGAGEVLPDAPKPTAKILPFRNPVSRTEAVDKLGALQRTPPLGIRSAFDGEPEGLSQRLREELVGELRAIQPFNMAPLSPRDEQAAGSVGDMFERAINGEELEDRGKGALSRMVVPCLKAAVIDRAPFDQEEHPARKLLSSLAEAVKDRRMPSDRSELMRKAEEAVDRVVSEFNEDMAILNVIEQELRTYMQQWALVAQGNKGMAASVAEAKREAEINATHALLERTAGVTLPYAVGEFMTGPWHRRLVRFGLGGLAGGPEWLSTLEVADQLLALWSVNPPTRRDAARVIQDLAPQMDAIWLDDGAPPERAYHHRQQLLLGLDEILRPEDMESHERQMAKMEAEMAKKPATDADRTFVRNLRVGDWVLLTGPDGTTRAAKLSWISPLSDRRLFVSRQGVRVMVATLDELASLRRIGRLKPEF